MVIKFCAKSLRKQTKIFSGQVKKLNQLTQANMLSSHIDLLIEMISNENNDDNPYSKNIATECINLIAEQASMPVEMISITVITIVSAGPGNVTASFLILIKYELIYA
uniref:Uncharacterized protein n=1 Tax=Glossina brevipalpis TaxID=37001 RepID=A0A1A9WRK7_9MUSC